MMRTRWILVVCTVLVVAGLAAGNRVRAAGEDFDAEAYWRGKTLTVIVPFREGSGTDLMARTLAPYLREYMPGQPRIFIENRPGADGATAMNYFDQAVAPDGYTMIFSPVIGPNQAFSSFTGARYDARRWHIIGSLGEAGVTYASTSRIKRVEDLIGFSERLFVALRGVPSVSTWDSLAGFDALGIPIQGLEYPGGAGDARAAVFRGEADVFNESSAGFITAIMPEVEAGHVIPLWQAGLFIDGELVRDQRAADIPTFAELYEQLTGKPLGEPHLTIYKMVGGQQATSRMAALPAGTPDHIARVIADAWFKATSDPEWQSHFEANGAPLRVGDAATARAAMLATLDVPEEIMNLIEEWYYRAVE